MHTMTLAKHTARLIACLTEAVEFAQTTSPGTGHNAGMWQAAISEAQQALAAEAELSTLRGAEVRELRAEIARLEASAPHAIALLRRLLDLYAGQRLAPPETFASYWAEVRELVANAPPDTSEAAGQLDLALAALTAIERRHSFCFSPTPRDVATAQEAATVLKQIQEAADA